MLKNFLFILFILSSIVTYSQSLKQYVKMGDKAFELGNYVEAANMYKKAIRLNNEILKVNFKYAEACRLQYKFKEAEKYYKKIVSKNPTSYPMANYYLAEVLKQQGQYQNAQKLFIDYSNKFGKADDYFAKKAKHEIYSCEKANLLMFDVKPVNIIKLDTLINSSYSELSTFELNDTLLYFSSYRPENSSNSNLFHSDIYISKTSNSIWGAPTKLNLSNDIDNYNISNFSYISSIEVIFSRCNKNKKAHDCKICKAKYNNGILSEIMELPENINMAGYVNTQAYKVDFQNEQFLTFSSNRPGGYGNMDIWISKVLPNGDYDIAQNIGNKINTPGNEISPYFNNVDSTLYFSSDWFENLGGFDILKVKGDFYYWNKPENLGYPINTVYNDLYYNINNNKTRAYLTSNRLSEGDNESAHCCNDIYYIKLKEAKKDSTVQIEKITKIILKDIRELIPITLYFHNDEPNPKTTDTITQFNYSTLFNNYILMIDEYKKEFSNKMKGEDKNIAFIEIEDFFSSQVEHGLNELEAFAQRLEVLMGNGENVIITLKGHTSPLNTAEYNNKLAKRRISSLKNYFLEYNNGIFQKYINNISTNYLKFELVAIGEELANKNVSDDVNDKRNSVYSPRAAIERKIQIIAISVPD